MKIFALYYDRYESATTSKVLGDFGYEHIVLCHNNSHKFRNIHEKGFLIETNKPKGIQNNMNHALSLLQDNEWCIMMSDDYKCSKKLKNGKFVDCDISYPIEQLKSVIKKADDIGVNLIGLNSTGNAFYAKKKYSKFGLVDGRCFAIKKTNFTYHNDINTIPDYYATAYHLKKYKGNLILNYTFCDFERYKKGGLGSINDRIKDKIKDCELLSKMFPNNIAIKNKVNQPKNSHVILKK